ncbi:MAG: 4Fe-4S binding protein [Campylobacteraceae bacterium]|nr:4Fe-4S binding protein [Campylobacteraceae bacterium]
MRNVVDRLKKMRSEYFWINPRLCTACWRCIKVCPKRVIDRVGFLWHRHIIIQNAQECINCKKCIKICPHGVFSKEMPDIIKTFIEKRGIEL